VRACVRACVRARVCEEEAEKRAHRPWDEAAPGTEGRGRFCLALKRRPTLRLHAISQAHRFLSFLWSR
jgi:hypothetical protein